MRIVALEEHYTVPGIVSRIDPAAIRARGFPGPDVVWGQVIKRNELAHLGDARLADMDASGITVRVLSVAGPGADVVPGAEGITLARDYNNALAEAASRHPGRFRGFAHLPMHSPDAAADELERTIKDLGFHGLLVNGPTDGRFLNDPRFEPILARAEALGVPIYIHPGIPPDKVREAYYDGLPGNFSFTLALSAGAGTWRPRSTCCGWF
jgi:predicted TIM-barrel fold metal-dependent hydrolase